MALVRPLIEDKSIPESWFIISPDPPGTHTWTVFDTSVPKSF